MKKILTFCLLVLATHVCAIQVWDGTYTQLSKGSGTTSNPYLIETPQHLAYLSLYVANGNALAGKCFRQTDDFDMNGSSGYVFTPIGKNDTNPFKGVYDGYGHTVSNVLITFADNIQYCALFGYIQGGGVINLNVENLTYGSTSAIEQSSILVAYMNAGAVDNCHCSSNITVSGTYFGGLIGNAEGEVTITNSTAGGTLTFSSTDADVSVGGLIGNYKSNLLGILDSHSTMNIHATIQSNTTGKNYECGVGGIVGRTGAGFSIGRVSNSGNLVADGKHNFETTYVYRTGVNSSGSTIKYLRHYFTNIYIGGLVGYLSADGTAANRTVLGQCSNTGDIIVTNTGTKRYVASRAGGIVGRCDAQSSEDNRFAFVYANCDITIPTSAANNAPSRGVSPTSSEHNSDPNKAGVSPANPTIVVSDPTNNHFAGGVMAGKIANFNLSVLNSYYAGAIVGQQTDAISYDAVNTYSNNYYLVSTEVSSTYGSSVDQSTMKSNSMPMVLSNDGGTIFVKDDYNRNDGYPIFLWQRPVVHTITFLNEDGTQLSQQSVAYGDTPTYTGATPTKASDAQYTYTFNGWTPTIDVVTADATYTATYSRTLNTYTVTFLNEDGTQLSQQTVAYGDTPAYSGATPTKAADAQYTYTFNGWTPKIVAVTGATTYTATYSRMLNSYKVTFFDEDGTQLSQQTVAYGDTPAYTGATPTKAADAQYTYTFNGWTPAIKAVTGAATYTATYLAVHVPTTWSITPTHCHEGDRADGNLYVTLLRGALAGDTIVMADGTYVEPYEMPIMNDVVIMAAPEAHPVIRQTQSFNIYASVQFKGIEFEMSTSGDSYCMSFFDNTHKYIKLDSCEFSRFTQNCIWAGAEHHIDSCVVSDCYFHDMTGGALYFSASSLPNNVNSCDYLKVTNSTFANISLSETAVVDLRNNSSNVSGSSTVLKVDHCTFYNCTGFDGMILSYQSPLAYVTNNIMANPSSSSVYSAVLFGGEISHNMSYNTMRFRTTGGTISGNIAANPMLVDTDNGNYALGDGSPAFGAGSDGSNLGDPRWWYAHAPCILASGTCGKNGDNLTWELSCDSVLTISGTGAIASLASMDQPWRNYMKRFKSVVIGDGVTSIGDSAFYNCGSLTTVTIPSSVTSIGRLALSDCSSLTSVTIPNSVTSIGYGTFVGCIGLTAMTVDAGNTVYDSRNNCNAIIETATNTLVVGCQNTVIPSSVTSIGDGAFRGCTGLTSVTIPSSVTSIEGCAFWYSGLTSIDIPSSVTSIGRQAFVNCYELASVDIPNSVTSIGNGAFINCRSLTSIDIPNSITSIGDSTFYHCTGLTAVTIPSGVTSIGLRAFYQCSGMTSLTLSNSVTSFGVGAFCGCYGLTSMSVDAGNTVYDSRNNCNAIIETATNTLVAGCQNTVIPNSVTSIGNFAFRECNTLTSIDIPGSVTSIGNGAFYGCTGLTTVNIPSGVINIGQSAFSGCSGLTSISCRATNAPELGSNMFNYVNKSIPLLVPAESIESYRAADQWKDFTKILPICPGSGTCGAEGDNLTWELSCDSVLTISGTGAMASLANMDPLWRAYMGNFKSVVIGNGITSIGDSAFYNCSHMTSVTIPSGITSIGIRTFYKCHNLTSVTIPNSVTSIGIGAFADGSSLTAITVEAGNTVYDSRDNCNAIIETATNTLIAGCQNTVIPNTVTSIGNNAFRECSSLTSIDIPNSVTSIGNYAFRACVGLTSVTIGNSVTSIGKYAFTNCSGLTSLIIPYGVTSIGEGAFSACSGLTSVIIPNSVTIIGDGAFYNSNGLTSVTIPSSVTSIGQYALGGCSGLTSITCKATNAPELGSNVFERVDKSIPLYVPAESLDAYKVADQWKDFNVQAICLLASGTCGAQGDNLTWELTCDSVLTISGTGDMANYESNNEFYSNPSLAPWCSDYQDVIKSVVISEEVTSIGSCAFDSCYNISSVSCPVSLTKIGWTAFANCHRLESFAIPNGVTSIEGGVFENCNSLISVVIPNSVTEIGGTAFMGCSSLSSIIIPNSVKSIGMAAFTNSGLTSVTIPNSVTTIGRSAFSDCSNLMSVVIGDGLKVIELWTFADNEKLESVVIGNSVTEIEGVAFLRCYNLAAVTIPNGVTTIGHSAFSYCRNLQSVTIPSSILRIDEDAFADCENLERVNISDLASWCSIIFDKANANPLYNAKHLFLNDVEVTNLVIPDGVVGIKSYAFTNAIGFTSVKIPNTVTSIGQSAFSKCNGLTSIFIPSSVISIGNAAFSGCSELVSLSVDPNNTIYDSRDNCNAIIEKASNKLILGCKNTIIPNDVISIGNYAFYRCAGLTSVVLPDGITNIGDYAFYNCNGLTSVSIPSSVTNFGKYVFASCGHLNLVEFLGNTPPTFDNDGTSGSFNLMYGNFSVPCGTKDAYVYAINEGLKSYYSIASSRISENVMLTYSVGTSNVQHGDISITHEPVCADLTLSFSATPAQGYEFLQWNDGNTDNPRSLTLVQDTVITAQWAKLYTITWKDEDGTVLATDTVREGVTPAYTGATPTKAATAQYTYTFNGWTPNVVAAEANAIYTATYNQTVNTYTVTFLDEDGTQLGQQTVAYGSAAIAPEVVVPDCHHMTWDVDFSNITGDLTVYAVRSLDIIASGTCGAQGDNLTWELTCDSILSIRGTGVMMDFAYGDNTSEWKTYSDKIKHVVFSEGVTKIGDHAFMNCYNLASVRFPNTMTNIGWSSFNGCSSLISVIVPEGVTYISYATFSNCSSLTSITLPSSLTSIADFAFSGCTALATITIPRNVTDLYHSVFSSCTGLTSITCEAVIPPTMVNDAFYNVDRTIPLYVPALSMPVYKVTERWKEFLNIQTLETAPTYTHVKIGALYYNLYANSLTAEVTYDQHWYNSNYSGLQNISIPNAVVYSGKTYNVVRIGVEAFGPCTSLSTVTIPSSIKTIGKNAFYNCVALTNVNMSEGLVYMDDGVFSGCSQLTSVTIPQSVAYMGTTMFHSCTKLRNVTLPDGLESVGYQMFYRCSGLSNMVLPDSVRQIGNYAFSGCSSMTAIYIPEHVRSIGMEAFFNCSGLRAIELPEEIESIDYVAFKGCTGLTSFTCNAITPPSLTCPVFEDVNTSIPLNVPCAGIPQYRATFCWNNFTNIQAIDTIVITPYLSSVNPNNGSVNIVERSRIACDTLLLTIKADPSDGYDFLQWSDGNTDNPRSLTLVQDTVIIAEWVKTYTITWKDADGTVLNKDTVREGVTPAYTGATPIKAADAQYTYTFNGWTPNVVAAEANAIYTATYSSTVNTYTVTFLDEDGTQLESKSVAYGETPVYTGETPTKDEDAQYTYTFEGWTPAIAAVTADATYTAVYSAEAKAPTAADYVPSTGRDFWLTFMNNSDIAYDNSGLQLRIYVVAEEATTINITAADGTPLVTREPVAAGKVYVYTASKDDRGRMYSKSSGKIEAKGVHVTSTKDVAVYAANNFDNGSRTSFDVTPVLATPALGTEYMVQTYYADKTATEMTIVARSNGTNVKITMGHQAVNDLGASFAKGQVVNISMNAGDVYQLIAEPDEEGYSFMSGTTVESSKPVAVFSGGINATVEYNDGLDGDHLFEQVIPMSAWGNRFILSEMHGFRDDMNVNNHTPTQYVFTAIYDDTKLYRNGVLQKTLAKGETLYDESYFMVDYDENPLFVEASKPVLCYGYLTNGAQNTFKKGIKSNSVGEPSMVLIPSTSHGAQKAVFMNYDGVSGSSAHHYVNVLVPDAAKSEMMLNGSNVGAQFATLDYYELDGVQWAYARLEVPQTTDAIVLTNAQAPFLAFAYGVQEGIARGYAYATTFNAAPASPKLYINDELMTHMDTLDFCNQHQGTHFTAVVDYPHTGVKWVLGEGAESTDYAVSHMYGATICEEDKQHDVKLFVYHESPLSHIKDTDSICVTLNIHPAYYDTLKTKVAANKLSYQWKTSSEVPFGLYLPDGVTPKYAQFALSKTVDLNGRKPWIEYQKDSANAAAWTDAHASFRIFDSLEYATRYGCDSIFYLQLEVVPDIIMAEENATVCLGEPFTWAGHHNAWNHLTQDGTPITTINTATAGTFVIRDTMHSKAFPYPDSICVLNLTVNPIPALVLHDVAPQCYPVAAMDVAYTATNAATMTYSVKRGDVVVVSATNTITSSSAFAINTAGLQPGTYTIEAYAVSALDCVSEIETLTFSILPAVNVVLDTVVCESYEWGSLSITESGIYSQRFEAANGCDSVVTINVTVRNPKYTATTVETCDSYTWNGVTYTESGTYVHEYSDDVCDNADTLHLTITTPVENEDAATICAGEPFVWHGQRLSEAGTYSDTVRSVGGCDSVIYRMNLTVAESYYDSITATACDEYVWNVNGNTYMKSGIYREELLSANGCDSILVLNLTIYNSYEFNETYTIEDTELPFTVHDSTYTAAGKYDIAYTTVNGCDSIYHITVVVKTIGAETLSVDGVISAADMDLGANSTVTITPNGHLVVPYPVYIDKLLLDYSDGHHAQVTGIGNIHAEVVEVLLNFPTPKGQLSKHWFAFAVPFEVSVATGIRLAGSDTPARCGYDFVIDEFDGVLRATKQKGWKRLSADAILYPGRMYMFATPKGTSWVLTATDPSELIEQTGTNISANTSSIGANHAGWNGIANTMFANATADMSGVTWITTYNNVLGVYETQEISDFVFIPSVPFFVQVTENAVFEFNDIPLFAPRRAQAENETSSITKLMLTDAEATHSDKVYVNFVTEKEDDSYLIGHDLLKVAATSQSVYQLWWDAYDMQLSAYEAPIGDEPRLLPIGLYAPENGDYTLSLTGVPADISVYLTKDGQPVWDIVKSGYTLPLNAGNNDGYALYVQRVKDVTTDYRTTETETQVQKVVMDDKVLILRDGKTYTVLGAEVK